MAVVAGLVTRECFATALKTPLAAEAVAGVDWLSTRLSAEIGGGAQVDVLRDFEILTLSWPGEQVWNQISNSRVES